jgi:adenylate cyclase
VVLSKEYASILLIISITLLILLLHVFSFAPLSIIEQKLLDVRFLIRGSKEPPKDVVILSIDEESLATIGRWPWPRDILGDIVEELSQDGAKAVAFDALFCEQEKNDPYFASCMSRAGNVVLPMVFDLGIPEGSTLSVPEFLFPSAIASGSGEPLSLPVAKSVLLPLPELAENAVALGHINMIPERDGVLRRLAMAVDYGGYVYPSLALWPVILFQGIPKEKIVLERNGIRFGDRFVPTDQHGRLIINYHGKEATFPHLSCVKLLEGKLSEAIFRDKIVLIGATALGLYDLRVTPLSSNMPGVEAQANIIANIVQGDFLRRVEKSTEVMFIAATGLLMVLFLPRAGAFLSAGLCFSVLASYLLFTYYLFARYGLWISAIHPGLNIVMTYGAVTIYRYASEEKEKRRIRSMFSSYVAPRIVEQLIKDPSKAKLGGDKREVTVLFSDIRAFTTFSERNRPEDVVHVLNEYLSAMTEVIFEHEGTLDKFVGDEIVAFWGAPAEQPDHALRAVTCALAMRRSLKTLQEKWKKDGKAPLDNGIGINTGDAIVGNIGAEGKKMDYTVIGDTVNLGARLEGLTRSYEEAPIIISEFTLKKVEGMIKTFHLGEETVKGKEKAVKIYGIAE